MNAYKDEYGKIIMHLIDWAYSIAPDDRTDKTKKEYTEYDLKKMQYDTINDCIDLINEHFEKIENENRES